MQRPEWGMVEYFYNILIDRKLDKVTLAIVGRKFNSISEDMDDCSLTSFRTRLSILVECVFGLM